MSLSLYDFEHFPRRPLQFKFDRRQLFSNIKIEMDVAGGEQQGGKGFKLSTLGILSESELGLIIPKIVSGCQISLADGFVWGRRPDSSTPQKLFPKEDTTLYVFNWINGRIPLTTIAHRLQQQTDWEAARCFAFTRGLFLHLVQMQICIPRMEG